MGPFRILLLSAMLLLAGSGLAYPGQRAEASASRSPQDAGGLRAYLPMVDSQAIPIPNGIFLGVFLSPTGGNVQFITDITNFQNMVGKKHAIYHFYTAWANSTLDTDMFLLSGIIQNGSVPMITWMSIPDSGSNPNGCNDPSWNLNSILDGSHDTYIRTFASAAAAWGHTLLIRWGHEMNLVSYSWAGYCNGADAQAPNEFILAFRHIHDIFVQEGATNVQFVWSPNCESYPAASWNNIDNYYPGDAYVDWIGVVGYNWGESNSNNNYRYLTFTDIFDSFLRSEAQLHPTKPLMVADYASVEDDGPPGTSKAQWISQAFAAMPTYTNLKAVVWFNGLNIDSFPDDEFRINSSAASVEAYSNAIAGPEFLSQTPWH
jgi:beta-mannanase